MAFCISPWAELHHYKQPDEGVRAERHLLWMDTGAAGARATDVAGCRLHLWKPLASNGAARGEWARQPRSHSQSRPLAAGDKSFVGQCVPYRPAGTETVRGRLESFRLDSLATSTERCRGLIRQRRLSFSIAVRVSNHNRRVPH